MLFENLGSSMLANMLTGKGFMRTERGYNMSHMDINF